MTRARAAVIATFALGGVAFAFWMFRRGQAHTNLGRSASRSKRYLPLSVIKRYEADMRRLGVSKVARSNRGFLTAFKRAGGDPTKLPPEWRHKRDAFVARHMAQVKKRDEPLWKDGKPTRRHLALIAWAYSPSSKVRRKSS